MAITTIPWNDGSGDNIYVSAPSQTGSQTVTVSSDENKGSSDRTKTVTFTATANGQTVTKILTLIQAKVAEQYIVFADPVVEAICATKWGDGTGITPSQAAQVTNAQFGSTFSGRTDITSFEEFSYFTGVTSIGQNAFNACSALERIVLPSSITVISAAFRSCSSLVYIDIPAGASFNTANPFQNDSALAEVTFRGTNTFVNYNWNGCSNLKRANIPSIDILASNSNLARVRTIGQYSGELHLYLIGSNTEITSPTFSNTLTSIKGWTFFRCKGLTSLTIPATVTEVMSSAFRGCSGLQSVTFASGSTVLGDHVFADCTGLSSFEFPSELVEIPASALESCTGLRYVEIPSSVTSIAAKAFYLVGGRTAETKCTYVIRATTPPTLANTNALVTALINKIYIPNGTLSAYQSATNWSTYKNYMAELDANGNIPT